MLEGAGDTAAAGSNWLIFQLLGPMPVKPIRSSPSLKGER